MTVLPHFAEDPSNFSLIVSVMTGIVGVMLVAAIDTGIESYRLGRKARKRSGARTGSDEGAPW